MLLNDKLKKLGKSGVLDISLKKEIKSIYSTINNRENIFFIFDKKCKSSELVDMFILL